MEKNKKKEKKLHLKLKSLFVLLFFLFLVVGVAYYIYNMPIKNILIEGTDNLTDKEIIEVAGIKDYPRMFKYSTSLLKKKISTLDLVDSVSISKNIFGRITIKIKEARVLFYNRTNSTYVLSNGKETILGDYEGVPFLVNDVITQIYERLIKELSKVESDSLALISEMEYSPSMSGDIVIDDTRFLLRMNDGNQVYINLINIDRLDTYPLIYTLFTEKGVLELDSDNSRVVFKSYKSILENQNKKESDKSES